METKNLSVNSDCLPPADQGCSELQEGGVAGLGLFEADQKFTVSVEPGMGSFHDPPAWFRVRIAVLDQSLFSS